MHLVISMSLLSKNDQNDVNINKYQFWWQHQLNQGYIDKRTINKHNDCNLEANNCASAVFSQKKVQRSSHLLCITFWRLIEFSQHHNISENYWENNDQPLYWSMSGIVFSFPSLNCGFKSTTTNSIRHKNWRLWDNNWFKWFLKPSLVGTNQLLSYHNLLHVNSLSLAHHYLHPS